MVRARNYVAAFIKSFYRRTDMSMLELTPDFIKEFASYIWDAKATDRGEDAPVKQHDHAMDAVRYFCYTILNNKRVRIKKKSSYGLN